ncbi:neurofilament heavy polypeptide [Drosophila gunungcola]|uniref:neurofilament heavy polypeptide n=1 Tax=Drosophila gunungcola TaxID=103775 RepID=UPI0022DF0F70|nr:neurofilament heavy polypeptide [Drosophila gunungcola]
MEHSSTSKYFECADINGKLYKLGDLSEEQKQKSVNQIHRQNLGTSTSRQAGQSRGSKNCMLAAPSVFYKETTKLPKKQSLRRSERVKNREQKLKVTKEVNTKDQEECSLKAKQHQPQSKINLFKRANLNKKLDDLNEEELGLTFRKQQQNQQRLKRRKNLGTAEPRQVGNMNKDSKSRLAKDPHASLQKDLPLIDWATLDAPEKPEEAPVLRRSARIQELKRKKEALEAKLKEDEKKLKSQPIKPRSVKRVVRKRNRSKTNVFPPYFECAEINGKLYKLYDVTEVMELADAFRKQQKQNQSSRRRLGAAGSRRVKSQT